MKMSQKRNAKRRGERSRGRGAVRGHSRRAFPGDSDDGVKRRGRGAVARLAHELREEISRMLWDGVRYREIIGAMGAKGIKLSMNSLTTWLKGGYQDWLGAQERGSQGERMVASALKVVKEKQGTLIQEAGLQLAAEQIYQVLMDFDPKVLKKGLKGDVSEYAKLVNVMARLGDGGLRYEKYRAEVAERKERILKELKKAERGGMTKARFRRIEGNLNLL
jgi:hypothetical protein